MRAECRGTLSIGGDSDIVKEWAEFRVAGPLGLGLCPLPPSQCVGVNCEPLHSVNLIFKYHSYHKVLRALWLGFCPTPEIS